MELHEFYFGQRVKMFDKDENCNVYGHITQIEPDKVCIKWNDINHPVWHEKNELPKIKDGSPANQRK